MYLSVSNTTKAGLRAMCARKGIKSDGLTKEQMVDLLNDSQFKREDALFREHMEWVANRPATVNAVNKLIGNYE